MSNLRGIIYYSNSVEIMNDTELKNLLYLSRDNNKKYGITGLLLHCTGSFVQYIEGDEQNLLMLMDNIDQDARHNNVIKVFNQEIEQRLFPNWSMAFKEVTQSSMNDIIGYAKHSDIYGVKYNLEKKVYSLMRSFAEMYDIQMGE